MSIKVVSGLDIEAPEFSADYLEQLRPFLMSQRRALLMQIDSIEKILGIKPTTADLRRKQKRDIMGD